MKVMNRSHILIALASLSPLVAAQAAKTPATAAPQAGAVTKEAAAPRAEPGQILLNVTGLTKDNETRVRQALDDIGPRHYACKTCKYEQATAGKCPNCKTDLAMNKENSLANVAVHLDSSTITLMPAHGGAARLSEIESALSRNAVRVDEGKLALSGSSTLILRGGDAATAAPLQKALENDKLFEEVRASFDAGRHELEVQVRAGANAPTRTSVAKAIESSGTPARLADVVWGTLPRKT